MVLLHSGEEGGYRTHRRLPVYIISSNSADVWAYTVSSHPLALREEKVWGGPLLLVQEET